MNNLMQKIGKCLDKNGIKSGNNKMLAQKIAALSVLGLMVLGPQVYAANTGIGTTTVTFGGTGTSDGTKTHDSDQNQLTTIYSAGNISVSSGLRSIYQEGQNLVLKLGSVDTASMRGVQDKGTLKIQAVLANQLPSEITWDSTNNKYVLNKDGTITADNTDLVTGGTVYNATGALDNTAAYYTISAGNNISQNLVALDNRLFQMSTGGV